MVLDYEEPNEDIASKIVESMSELIGFTHFNVEYNAINVFRKCKKHFKNVFRCH
jgi:hypothetical protein